jgi:hypothetical protein
MHTFTGSVGILPLILQLKSAKAQQMWYADDLSAGSSKLAHLNRWWDRITEIGPELGQYSLSKRNIMMKLHNFSRILTSTSLRLVANTSALQLEMLHSNKLATGLQESSRALMYLRSCLNLMACSEAEIFTTAILLFVFSTVAEEIACSVAFDL